MRTGAGTAILWLGLLALGAAAPPGAHGEETTFPLTVRDGETGRPVAGATVQVVLHARIVAERLRPRFDEGDVGAVARRLGVEVHVLRGHDRQTAHVIRPTPPPAGQPIRTTLLAGKASRVDVEVCAPGRRTVRVDDVEEAARIALEPAIPLRVALPAGWSAPATCAATEEQTVEFE